MAKIISCIIIIISLFLINGSTNQSNLKSENNVIVEASIGSAIETFIYNIKVFLGIVDETPVEQPPSKDDVVIDTIKIVFEDPTVSDMNGELGSIIDDDPVNLDPYTKFRNGLQEIYFSQIGIREKTGKNDGKEVEEYLASADLSKGNPWCASFIYWSFEKNGVRLNIASKGWVPSYFPKKKTIYVRGQYKTMEPKYGDLIGIWFEDKGRLAHIGFYDYEDDKYYYSVEGNTNVAGSREGDGVYSKKRIKRQVHSISNWID